MLSTLYGNEEGWVGGKEEEKTNIHGKSSPGATRLLEMALNLEIDGIFFQVQISKTSVKSRRKKQMRKGRLVPL